MSGDCCSSATSTPQVSQSKPIVEWSYPISLTVLRTMVGMSTYVVVVISPPTSTKPVLVKVSHATRQCGSFAMMASRTASETASQTLSG